ncbi:MAG: hypothetical protein ACXV0U_03580 [Kineosporiaceae bacterium]
MGDVVALRTGSPVAAPQHGEVFADARGDGRTMRVTWHQDDGLVVLSIWRGGTCHGTFRLAQSDLPALLRALTDGPLGLL